MAPKGSFGHHRRLLVAPQVGDLLDGTDTSVHVGLQEARLVIDRYLAGFGLRVGFGRPPKRMKKRDRPVMERLDPLDESWVLCVRKPGSGCRFFGRFLDKDLFVIFTAVPRDALKTDLLYAAAAKVSISYWNRYLPGIQHHTGAQISDYLSGPNVDAYV